MNNGCEIDMCGKVIAHSQEAFTLYPNCTESKEEALKTYIGDFELFRSDSVSKILKQGYHLLSLS